MKIEGLTIEEAKEKLTQTENTLADLEAQNKQAKEAILSTLISAGKSDAELIAIGFKQSDIDAFRLKEINIEQAKKIEEGIKKTLEKKEEDIKELKRANTEQVERLKRDIEKKLQEKENENDNPILKLGKRLRRAGLKEEDVASIPGWENLNNNQRMLVVEQISQQALLDIKKAGEERFKEKNTISWKVKNFNPLSFGKKLFNNLRKSVMISKEEKGAIEDFKNGRLKPDAKNVESIIERMVKMDLEVVEKDGKYIIEFAKLDPSLTPETKNLFNLYNNVANQYASMPDAWRNEKAAASRYGKFWNKDKSKKSEEYNYKKEQYMAARGMLLEHIAKELEASGVKRDDPAFNKEMERAMIEISRQDGIISMLQYTTTNPDAFAEIDKIENEASYKRFFNNENLWRGLYATMGYSLRKGSFAVSWFAAPVVSAVMGGFRANRKAGQKINAAYLEGRQEKTFREMTQAERMQIKNAYADANFKKDANGNVALDKYGTPIMKDGSAYKPGRIYDDKNEEKGWLSKTLSGKEVNAKEMVQFIDADSQIQRLSRLMEKLENAEPQDKVAIASSINARIAYIQSKHEQGLVNYGTENAVTNNYNMLELMSQAAVAAYEHKPKDELSEKEIDEGYIDASTLKNIEERREELLYKVMRNNRLIMEDKQAQYKEAEIKRGIAVAAGAATLGRLIGFFSEHINFGRAKEAADVVRIKINTTDINVKEITQVDNTVVADSADSFIIKLPRPSIDSVTTTEINPDLAKNELEINSESTKAASENNIATVSKIPKPDIIEDNKNIKLDNKDIVSASKISTAPVIVDESVVKTGGVEFQDKVSNENIDLSGAHQVTEEGATLKTEMIPTPKLNEDEIDLSGARKVSGPDIVTEKVDEYGLGTVVKTETPILMDDNVRPTEQGGFNNQGIGTGKEINPREKVGGYNTGEETGNVYPRSGALKGGPNPESISREVPMTDREAIFTNKGNNVFENGVDNNVNENLPMESDPRHFETAKEIRQTFGSKTVLIDKAEYPTLDQTEDGVDYNDWNTANDNMFKQKGLEFNSYEDFNKERELQELFGVNTPTENPAKIVYDQNLGRNVEIPKHVSITQEYFRDMPEWKTVEKIPAKYFFQDDFLNGNKLPQAELDALVRKGIISQNPLTGTYSFSHRNEIERMSAMYKKLVSSKDYEKFIDKVEHTLGNEKPIGNENMETYIKRITAKIYKADDNTLFGFKRPVDWDDRDSWSRDYDGGRPSQDRMMRPISPTRRIYER